MGSQDQVNLDTPSDHVLMLHVKKLESRLQKIQQVWPKPIADLEASYLGVVTDIKVLSSLAQAIQESIGSDALSTLGHGSNSGLSSLAQTIKESIGSDTLSTLGHGSNLGSVVVNLFSAITTLELLPY